MLKRITTEYNAAQDRVQLVGELENDESVALWLTWRLLNRLVPVLCQWLEAIPGTVAFVEVMNSFAQQAAQATLEPQAPVGLTADTSSWLVHSVDIAQTDQWVQLTFKGEGALSVILRLEPTPLRQWLGILRQVCLQAHWPTNVWPQWLGATDIQQSEAQLLH